MIETDFILADNGDWLRGALLADVRHATSTRRLVRNVGERADVAIRLRDALSWGNETPIVLAEQVHGRDVAVIEKTDGSPIREMSGVDALVTRSPGVMIGVFTADCVPILFADTKAGVIGAVHAGWRGTHGMILAKALQQAFALGAKPQDTRAWIGPSICGNDYEVSVELADEFRSIFPDFSAQTVRGRRVDLPRLNALMALGQGLIEDNVSLAGLCTKERSDLLCSYRVEVAQAGRMFSAIML